MTPREKKLVIAVVIVAFVAGIDFIYSALQRSSNDQNQGQIQKTEAAISKVGQQLAGYSSGKDDVKALHLANTPYAKEPVAFPGQEDRRLRNSEQLPFLSLSGFMRIGHQFVAIINGQEYQVGDWVAGTDEKVVAIDSTGVVLRFENTGAERKLTYQEALERP